MPIHPQCPRYVQPRVEVLPQDKELTPYAHATSLPTHKRRSVTRETLALPPGYINSDISVHPHYLLIYLQEMR